MALLLCLPTLALAAAPLDASRFSDLDGQAHSVTQLRGKVLLVNFWASWCAPCRQEIPMLKQLSVDWRRHDIEVVGIALDDAAAVRSFLKAHPSNYRIWLGNDATMDQMPALGNPAMVLPFTILLDRQGKKIASWSGQLSAGQLREALAPYLR